MSKKIREPESLLERGHLPRWSDETTISDNSVDISEDDISDQEYDTIDPECKGKPINDIWEPDTIWTALQVIFIQQIFFIFLK